MGDTLHLFRGDLAGTEIQPLIDLAGIRGNNLPVEAGSQFHPKGTFPRSVCSLDDDEFRQHAESSIPVIA